MKTFEIEKTVCVKENDIIRKATDRTYVRDVTIPAGIGTEVRIGLLSDVHINYCNERDFAEADPVIMSTFENRKWNANAESIPKLQRAFDFLDDMDQIVLCGDTLDYISHGTMELMQREVWDKHPDVLAVVGGHELHRKMQGKVDDPLTDEEKLNIIKGFWKHDVYYATKLIRDKVLAVAMLDHEARFYEEQLCKLRADIEKARQNGYALLLFVHEPFATHNPADREFRAEDTMHLGDPSGYPRDFCDGTARGTFMIGSDDCDQITREVYDLITHSADVIRAVVAGHFHSDIHLEITAQTPDGKITTIPQFISTALAYGAGHMMRIRIC
jgi:predicted phosphodiesterase